MRHLSDENQFDLHENEPVNETHAHMNSFTRRLVLTIKQKTTRKWPCHTEDGRGNCRNMFVKLKRVVFFLKFISSLLLSRPFVSI